MPLDGQNGQDPTEILRLGPQAEAWHLEYVNQLACADLGRTIIPDAFDAVRKRAAWRMCIRHGAPATYTIRMRPGSTG